MFFLFSTLLLLAAYFVFRKVVRSDYLTYDHLRWPASLLQLLIFVGFMGLPYLYSSPDWPRFWDFGDRPTWNAYAGFILIMLGFLLSFGTMVWFGLRRAFGRQTGELVENGFYRWSRNPQILGGYLLVAGTAFQQPAFYALIWVVLYSVIAQMMIITEEEYLRLQFGEAYDRYCAHVPRYIRLRK